MAYRRSLPSGRDDKQGRVAERRRPLPRDRAVDGGGGSFAVRGRKAPKSICQEVLPGSFDSAPQSYLLATDLRSASLRMTALLVGCNIAGCICRKHETLKVTGSQDDDFVGGRVSTQDGPVYSSSIWRSKGTACMQSSCAIFFRAAFKAELGQGSTVTTKGRRSFG